MISIPLNGLMLLSNGFFAMGGHLRQMSHVRSVAGSHHDVEELSRLS